MSIMNKWFQTWSRPEYIEWALPQKYGYLLIIARKQTSDWLLARAKLLFKKNGLPDVELLETKTISSKKEAIENLDEWKKF